MYEANIAPDRSTLRGVLRGLLFVLVILIYMPFVYPCWRLRLYHARDVLVMAFYRQVCLILGIGIHVRGVPDVKRPLLVVSNHMSYIDVFVLASVMHVKFTPKSDVAGWPMIGWMCKLAGCIFIDRRIHQTKNNQNRLVEAVARGEAISLFPEATTNDGTRLLPFKSSYFSLAEMTHEGHGLPVQPVSLLYTGLNGSPLRTEWLPYVGWYGDMDFFPHFWNLLKLKSLKAEVEFYPAQSIEQHSSRKALSRHCEQVIGQGLKDARRLFLPDRS